MATPYKNLVQLESVTNQYYAKHIAPILEREIKLIKEYNIKIVKEAYKEAKRNSAETTLSRIFIGGDLSVEVNAQSIANRKMAEAGYDAVLDRALKKIYRDKNINADFGRLTAYYDVLLHAGLGEKRYKEATARVKKQFGKDEEIASHYVGLKLQELLVQQLVRRNMPKNDIEYILRKSFDNTISFSLASLGKAIAVYNGKMKPTPVSDEVYDRALNDYNASPAAKTAAFLGGYLLEAPVTGVFGGGVKAAAKKIAGYEIAGKGIEYGVSKFMGGDGYIDNISNYSSLVFGNAKVFPAINDDSRKYNNHATENMVIINGELRNKIKGRSTPQVSSVLRTYRSVLDPARGSSTKLFNTIAFSIQSKMLPIKRDTSIPKFMLYNTSKANRSLAATFYAQMKDMSDKKLSEKVLNGRKVTFSYVAQRAYDYARAAVEVDRQSSRVGKTNSSVLLKNTYSDLSKFHVRVDTQRAVPRWMFQKSSSECKILSDYFLKTAKKMSNEHLDTYKINGKTFTLQQVAQRAYDYARTADSLDHRQGKSTVSVKTAFKNDIQKTAGITMPKENHKKEEKSRVSSSGNEVKNNSKVVASDKIAQQGKEQNPRGQQISASPQQQGHPHDRNNVAERQIPSNMQGWSSAIDNMGMREMSDMRRNMGYVIAMLPDMLIGMFTGKTPNFKLEDNLLPLASIFGGMFFNGSPLARLFLLAYGGSALLKNSSKEVLGNLDGSAGKTTQRVYKQYGDEVLNPRIVQPVMKGNTLVASIDGKPMVIRISNTAVDAYEKGAVPLNTLANAVLQKYDASNNTVSSGYESQISKLEAGQQTTIGLR